MTNEFAITPDTRMEDLLTVRKALDLLARLGAQDTLQEPRTILTGAGPMEVKKPRVKDKEAKSEETIRFTSWSLANRRQDMESAAQGVLALVDRLIATGLDAPAAERRELFSQAVVGIEMDFVREKPKTGKRLRPRCRGARITLPTSLQTLACGLPAAQSVVREAG